jgi:predicted amidophosphoribosyltransferase
MFFETFRKWVLCRGCLRTMSGNSEAGLCGSCWEGLWPLSEKRCPRCALEHDDGNPCPDTVAWEHGDALWNYRGGRPALGSLLVHGIKAGETGWRRALLKRLASAELPAWAGEVDLVTSAPPSPLRRWQRGFDLTEEAARLISDKLNRPYVRTLGRALFAKRQAKLTESRRRRMSQKNVYVRSGVYLSGSVILLVDDVWTTGTTLLRCAQALKKSGATDIRVFTLFRVL